MLPLCAYAPQGCFNSRPCVRGDMANGYREDLTLVFQFTPLREGRPKLKTLRKGRKLFQFTPLREGRQQRSFIFCQVQYSFNSRPCVRGDARKLSANLKQLSFNSRPCVRGDQSPYRRTLVLLKFQFTPLREGRPIKKGIIFKCDRFQFTPLREGRLCANRGFM